MGGGPGFYFIFFKSFFQFTVVLIVSLPPHAWGHLLLKCDDVVLFPGNVISQTVLEWVEEC